jgi:hypothetical protein
LFGLFFQRVGAAGHKAGLTMFHAQTMKKLPHLGRTPANAGELFDGVLSLGAGGGWMLAKMRFQTALMGT